MSKTTMQELIEFFDLTCKDNEMTSYDGQCKLTELLAKEKEQIVDAYIQGYADGGSQHTRHKNSKDYFDQTYK